jgi:hypothetical protein
MNGSIKTINSIIEVINDAKLDETNGEHGHF